MSQGKRKRGAQPGNLNATKYTWRALARRGQLVRAEDRWVLPLMEDYRRALESDKPDASEAEKRLIELAARVHGIQALLLARTADEGIAAPLNARQSVAQELRGYMSLELSALNALGLERRARPAVSLDEYVREKYGNRAAQEPTIEIEPDSK